MLSSLFATKIGMTQAWDKQGRRLAVTKCRFAPQMVVGTQSIADGNLLLIGFGKKKLANMTKPLRTILERGGFTIGVRKIRGVKSTNPELKTGDSVEVSQIIKVGDLVKVRGTTKGKGFAGAVKRHGFKGGPKTHGQSDRQRAVGSIGSGTTPGRVLKGKRMPGQMGDVELTVKGLVILHIDPIKQELWLSGPVPGSIASTVEIMPTGKTKELELDAQASGITLPVAAVEETVATAAAEEVKA